MAEVLQIENAALDDGKFVNQQLHYTEHLSVCEADQCVSVRDLHPAERFLRLLDPKTEQFCFRTFDDTEQDRRFARKFNGSFKTNIKEFESLNRDGFGVFVVVNEGGQNNKGITKIRGVFADTDGAQLEPLLVLQPHIVINTSPGRWHVYWLVDDNFQLDKFTLTQEAIANKFGTDKSVKDLPRVMRLPGFKHCKQSPVEVTIQEINKNLPRYSYEEIVSGLNLEVLKSTNQTGCNTATKTHNLVEPMFGQAGSISEGGRNANVLSHVGSLRHKGVPEDVMLGIAMDYNLAHCNPPLDPNEVLDIVNRYAPPQESNDEGLHVGSINFSDCLPPPRNFVIQHLLLSGKSAVLAGLGGVSKTQLAIQAGLCIATGRDFLGRQTKQGSVLLLLGEEDQAEINRRFNATAAHMNLSLVEKTLATKCISALPMVGVDMRFAKSKGGAIETTGFMPKIIQKTAELKESSGGSVEFIVLDHVGLIHGGDFNAREDVVRTVSLVNELADKTGAAVLLLAHSPKSTTNSDEASSDDVAGSRAWVDNTRASLILKGMTGEEAKKLGVSNEMRKEYISLSSVKGNYIPSDQKIWLAKKTMDLYETVVLDQIDLQAATKSISGANAKLRSRILELVSEKPYLTRNKIDLFSGKDCRLGASKANVRSELDSLIADGLLGFRDPTQKEREQYAIKGKTDGILVLRIKP